MNKKFFKISFLGVFLFTLLGTFVACSDYDDDINNLQTQIDETKSDLTSLVNDKIDAINSQISGLSSTQQSLQAELAKAKSALEATQADLQTTLELAEKAQTEAEKATAEAEVAKQLAQTEAAAAQIAAIAAAEKAVSDAKTELETKVNALESNLSEMGSSIATLLEANTELTTTLSAAVARLDQAESMLEAVKTDIENNAGDIQTLKAETANLNSIIEALRTEITGWNSGFDSQLLDLLEKINANKAYIASQETALSEYKTLMDERWENMEEKVNQINTLETELEALKSKVEGQKELWENYANKIVEEAIEELRAEFNNHATTSEAAFEAYKVSQKATISALENEIEKLQEDIVNLNKQLEDINKEIRKINDLLSGFRNNFDKLITSVVLQALDYQLIWGQFTNNNTSIGNTFKFGPGNGTTYTKNRYHYYQEGAVYVTVNPNTVDITDEILTLENSIGNTPGKFELLEAKRAEALVTRAATNNGFWELDINYTPSQGSAENPVNAVEAGLFAVVAQYDIEDEDEDGNSITKTKKVYSQYNIELDRNILQATVPTDFILRKVENSMTAEIAITDFIPAANPSRFYQQYITTTNADEAAFIESGIDEIFEGNSRQIVANDQARNKVIEFEWRGLNYDGSVISKTISVLFAKPLFGPDNISFSHQPVNGNTQNAIDATEFSNLEFIKTNGSNHSAWVKNAVSQDITITPALPANALTIEYLNTINTPVTLANITAISRLQVNYNPATLEVGKEYTIQIDYKDKAGNLVNTLNVAFTMEMPELPIPLGGDRIPAAFNGNLTTAWAISENGNAVYDLIGSINDLQEVASPLWKYAFRDATNYNLNYRPEPNFGNVVGNYTIKIPKVAIEYSEATVNKGDYNPKVYTLKEGVEFYNLAPLFNQFDEFQISFKSAVNWADFTMAPIEIRYGGESTTVTQTHINSQDPSVAYTKQIKYLTFGTETGQTAIKDVNFKVDPSDRNRGLIDENQLVFDSNSGTLTFVTTTNVSLQSDTEVNIIMEVTDMFDIVTRHDFPVKVIKP